MKKKYFIFIFCSSCIFMLLLKGYSENMIKELCKKKEAMYEKMKDYIKIANIKTFSYNQKGKLLTEDKQHYEFYWNGKKWIETGKIEKSKSKDKDLDPFKFGYQQFFTYLVKDEGDDYIIKVELKEKFKNAYAEIGTYTVSKKTGYFKEENTTLNRMPSPFIKTFKMITEYGMIEKNIIAPVKMKNIVNSKILFGVGRKIIIITKYSYKKKN